MDLLRIESSNERIGNEPNSQSVQVKKKIRTISLSEILKILGGGALYARSEKMLKKFEAGKLLFVVLMTLWKKILFNPDHHWFIEIDKKSFRRSRKTSHYTGWSTL